MPRIISWNTRGKGAERLNAAYGDLLFNRNDHIIMIQEGGNTGNPSGAQFSCTFGTRSRGHSFQACFFDQPDAKIQKCTTGLLVEDGFEIDDEIFCFQGFGKRPIVACRCSYTYPNGTRRDFVFATVHLTANEEIAKDELESVNDAFRNQYDGEGIQWLIMGDFNCQADMFRSAFEMNISYPPNMTHEKGKILDFALYSDNLKGKINVRLCTDRNGKIPAASDHFPICCEF